MAQPRTMLAFIDEIRTEIQSHHPALISLFETYAAEAMFGREMIDADLQQLSVSASILEIGAGALILSCQLLREGYNVTALEPIGEGFSHFKTLQDVVLSMVARSRLTLNIISAPAERLNATSVFDYAFSINVMEHVNDEKMVIENVLDALKVGAKYRFICPNYTFPYEPHFNIPTFFSKGLTERIFKNKITTHQVLSDPWGTWQSLNWISVSKVKRIIHQSKNTKISFNRSLLKKMIERALVDKQFSMRRSTWMTKVIRGIIYLNLHELCRLIPASLQPVMDCTLQKS